MFKLSKENMGALLLIYIEKLISNQVDSDQKLASRFCYVNGKFIEHFELFIFEQYFEKSIKLTTSIFLPSYIDIRHMHYL